MDSYQSETMKANNGIKENKDTCLASSWTRCVMSFLKVERTCVCVVF